MNSGFSDRRLWVMGPTIALCLGILLASSSFGAEPASTPPLKDWQKMLEDLETGLKAADIGDEGLIQLRQKALSLREALAPARSDVEHQAASLRQDLEALGPIPQMGEPVEARAIKAKRQALMDQLALTDATGKETDLIRSRLDRLMDGIKIRRREQFAERVLQRSVTPLSPSLWAKALPEWFALGAAGFSDLQALMTGLGTSVLAAMAFGVLLLMLAYRWAVRRLEVRLDEAKDSQNPKALGHFLLDSIFVLGVLGIGAAGLSFGGGPEAGTLPLGMSDTMGGLTFTLLAQRFFYRVLNPEAGLTDMAPERALRLRKVASALALLFVLEVTVEGLIASQNASLEVTITNQVIMSLLAGGVLVMLLPALKTPLVRAFTFFLIFAIGLSVLGGFVAMGRLLATRGVITVGLWVGIRTLFRVIESFGRTLLDASSDLGAMLRAQFRIGEEETERVVVSVEFGLKSILSVVGLFSFLFLWTLDRKDLLVWMADAFREIKVGNLTLYPYAIVTGLVLFVILLAGVRALQRFLDDKIFPRTHFDIGVRHSILSGFGYIGIALAAMLSVSVMGVNLANIAVIAGALSVGIGFGLQNIVNNFVSGVILLIERPIKVGDWVVVGEHQGVVRNISVRATQITTLDRTTIYVPNSSLISGMVQNKTHPERIGRVVMPVTVDQDQDIEVIRPLLLALAQAQPEVRAYPEPQVYVTALSETAISLELVAFIQDVGELKSVTSALYGEILRTFREQGIRRKPAKPQEMNLRVLELPSNAEASADPQCEGGVQVEGQSRS